MIITSTWGYRIALLIGVAMLLALQLRFWVGEGSFAHIHSLEQEVNKVESENILLRERNQRLQARIADLKNSEDAIEATARYELGLVKDGEVLLRLPEVEKAQAQMTNRKTIIDDE